MSSKMTTSALVAMLLLTIFAALPQLTHAQEAASQSQVIAQLYINWNINLSGTTFNGMKTVGAAEYEVEGSRRRFSAEADNVNLPNGTKLTVYVAGKSVGSISLVDNGGTLLLDTFAHQNVPYVAKGTTVAIYYGSTKLVSGHF